jgi:WD40 repeat protein
MVCDDRELLFWDITSGQMVTAIRAGGRVNHAAFSPDGRTVAFSGPSNVVFLETPDPRRVPNVPRTRPIVR